MKSDINNYIRNSLEILYMADVDESHIQLLETRKEFKGDITLVVFPLLRYSSGSPEETAKAIGDYLKNQLSDVQDYNVINGFLNITFTPDHWIKIFSTILGDDHFGMTAPTDISELILIEYSSPNTNKPLHLGHIRNNLIGFSLARILESNGYRVIKTNIVNDRGIHICKSMVAWMKFGNGETPENSGEKGDHLVGRYYVRFERELSKEVEELERQGKTKEEAWMAAPLLEEARELLRKWEAGDTNTVDLWETMNGWVYDGFNVTYDLLGIEFDKIYHESETFKSGKEIVINAIEQGYLFKKPDGSVWVDLSEFNLEEKLLLRSDGTTVYMTQDIGTAVERYNDFGFDRHLYVVGNEQNYHFQVLKLVLKKLGYGWSDGLFHFSYGMVELPEGKMKSREGTIVDADDLIKEMIHTAYEMSEELGKLDIYTGEEKDEILRKIGLGALKYFILKVDPKKNMMFNPVESIDFNGNTGPFIQYTYSRIQSIMRKAGDIESFSPAGLTPNQKEIELIKLLNQFPTVVSEAGENLSPALLANYCYDLSKVFNQYYHDYIILGESDLLTRRFRIKLTWQTGEMIRKGMWLLGIELPDRM